MESSLQGKLAAFRLPDLLTFLHVSRKSGRLTLQSRSRSAHIHFDRGEIIFAWSNQKKFRLGKILQKKKRIGADQAKAIEAAMLEENAKFGRVAVEHKILTDPELLDFLKIQVSEILYDSFIWDEGNFHFHDNSPIPEYAVTISVDLSNLIMEGARRIDEWDHCQMLLPSPAMIFRVIATPEFPEKITLTLNEWKILFLIDGKRTLSDICELAEEEALEVYRVVYGLCANKLVEPIPEGELLAGAVLALQDQPADISHTSEMTTGSMRGDTDLLMSPGATLSYRDIVRVKMARLVLKESQAVFPLEEEEYLIGRTPGSHIHLSDPSVSSVHARVFRAPEGYAIQDMNSRNGTYVNEQRVETKVLQENDSIRIGASELTYHVVTDAQHV